MNKKNTARDAQKSASPPQVDGLDLLTDLALDLRWSWNHRADELWRRIDPNLWDLTHNPWVVLQTVSRSRLQDALADADFRQKAEELRKEKNDAANAPAWFQKTYPKAGLNCVAYFSMEFMLSEALPIYSGGLGNVAGDQLKAASDLGVPVVGVGLLYQQGYFRQAIGHGGVQQALYPYNDPGQLPITPLRDANGEWLRLEVKLPGYSLWTRAWSAQIGRVKLYLIDSNDPANLPAHRGITSELYGGDSELRLKQELALGLGGWRLLRAIGLQPQVCHLNEGHAAFAVLERAKDFMADTGQKFDVALAATRAGNLFTTHTAVPAGFDRFDPPLIERYLSAYAGKLGLAPRELLALGRLNPNDASEPFNMAYLAVRGSGAVNGVSLLHGEVSRQIFASLYPRWPEAEVPIGHVTNGVHIPSWISTEADALWSRACGEDCWVGTTESLGQAIRKRTDAEIWQMRKTARNDLINYARERVGRELQVAGASAETLSVVQRSFDPNVLTLAFARRFATYKRPNLLLRDPERLLRLLTNPKGPVQLILAGKAHPADEPGKAMIQEWMRFISRPEARPHVIFLTDYDMSLAEHLVQGADVWLNTPRRPWEASGTSGMKVLANGGLNVSELDGWWAEAYTPQVGWALGDGREHGEDPAWDRAEADRLFQLLENEVVPAFYTRDKNDIPTSWVARIRESMATLAPQFSANRTVREYTEKYYLPAFAAYQERTSQGAATGIRISKWRRDLEFNWSHLRFGNVQVETNGNAHKFQVEVFLDPLTPDAVRLELYAAKNGDGDSAPREMSLLRKPVGPGKSYLYGATAPASRPAADYTPRLLPRFTNANVPLEASEILWQK